MTVRYTITDNDSMGAVAINGKPAVKSGDSYSHTLALDAGKSWVVVARDRSGNLAKDSLAFAVGLKDRDGTGLRFGRMPDGRIWTLQNLSAPPPAQSVAPNLNGTVCVNDSCAKYGRSYSWSMAMDLPTATEAGGGACGNSGSTVSRFWSPTETGVPSASLLSIQQSAGFGGLFKGSRSVQVRCVVN